jgi:hypothetical protein
MAKKNFIRHLEYYGFPDQNVYDGLPNIDLSDIYKTNEEQDKEISEISGETNSKADMSLVIELSGKVDTFIDAQTTIDGEILESLSGITNKINEIADTTNQIDSDLEGLENSFQEHIVEFNEFKDYTNEKLEEKLDSTVAEETYAKKVDVYTKEEADAKFITDLPDISDFVKKEELNAVIDDLEALSGQVESLGDKYATDEELNELKENLESQIESAKTELDSEISNINESISAISETLVSISGLTETVSELEEKVDGKVNNEDFVREINSINNDILALNTSKASKAELLQVSGAVDSLASDLDAEIAARINGDELLGNRIDGIYEDIESLSGDVQTVKDDMSSLESELEQEIFDRIEGDNKLIGDKDLDTAASDSIWGAKRYSEIQRGVAVTEAKSYTDNKFGSIETLVDNKLDEINTELSGKADKTYVDGVVEDSKEETLNTVYEKYDPIIESLRTEDENLETEIEWIKQHSPSADTKEIYRRINIITTYSGDSADDYVDTGNGVLDVLHREFHELENEIGVVTNPTLQRTNEYEAAFGTYNISNTDTNLSGQTAFSIGIGTSELDRRNALEVRKDGSVYMWVEGEYLNVNDLLSMLAHETYN